MIVEFVRYFHHRLFHTSYFYKRFHKIHHEYKSTIFCASTYCHPLEMVFCNLLPAVVGPLLLGKSIHVTSVFGFYLIAGVFTIIDHSGYEFAFSPFRLVPFGTDYGYHVFHHSHAVGNFSTMWLGLDTLFGTNKDYWEAFEQHCKDRAEQLKIKSKSTLAHH